MTHLYIHLRAIVDSPERVTINASSRMPPADVMSDVAVAKLPVAAQPRSNSPSSDTRSDFDMTATDDNIATALLPADSTLAPSPILSKPSTAAVARRRVPAITSAVRLRPVSTTPPAPSIFHYTLVPPTLSLSPAYLSSPHVPSHLPSLHHRFCFSHISPALESTSALHRQLIAPLTARLWHGDTSVVLIAGKEGAGKTFTAVGDSRHSGVVLLAIADVLRALATHQPDAGTTAREEEKTSDVDSLPTSPPRQYKATLSVLLHRDASLHDLITGRDDLTLRLDPYDPRVRPGHDEEDVEVRGLSEHVLTASPADAVHLLLESEKHRARLALEGVRGTVLYTVRLHSRVRGGGVEEGYQQASLTVVDVAAPAPSFPSASWINTSTFALNRVVRALSAGVGHVPYRDSGLTMCLQAALRRATHIVLLWCLKSEGDGWRDAKDAWRWAEELGVVTRERRTEEQWRQRRQQTERRRQRSARWSRTGGGGDSDEDEQEYEMTDVEYYLAECAKRTVAHPPATQSRPPPTPSPCPAEEAPHSTPRSFSPPPPEDAQPAALPPSSPSPPLTPSPPVPASPTASELRLQKDEENRRAMAAAREAQAARDLKRAWEPLLPLCSLLSISPSPPLTPATAVPLIAQRARQRLSRGLTLTKVSVRKGLPQGSVKARTVELKWDEVLSALWWTGTKRLRRVRKELKGKDVVGVWVGGRSAVMERWRKEGEGREEDAGRGVTVATSTRALDVVCSDREQLLLLVAGLKAVLGEAKVHEEADSRR